MYVHVRDQNDNATYASTRWVPTVRHFLACEDVASGSQQSGGESFFCPDALPCVRRCSWWVPAVRGKHFIREIQWPVRWVPAVRWRNHYFPRHKEELPCCGRGLASPHTVHVRWKSFLHHIDHVAPRAPGWWTMARPRKGTTRRQGRLGSCFSRGGEYDCTRVYWFIYRR